VDVLICEANPRVTQKLRNAGIVKLIGEESHFQEFQDALKTGLANREKARPLPENVGEFARQVIAVTRQYFRSADADDDA
jgi:hypothetical protein